MAEKQSPVKNFSIHQIKNYLLKKIINNIITHMIFTMGAQEGIVIAYIKHSS